MVGESFNSVNRDGFLIDSSSSAASKQINLKKNMVRRDNVSTSRAKRLRSQKTIKIFLEFASLIGLLLYSIWSRLWLSIKPQVL
jgi:hypothetical protein